MITYNFKNPQVVTQIETEYPEMTAEYKRIVMEQYETFCLKQSNYGPGNISVGTSLSTPEDVKLSLTGLWFRMNDTPIRFSSVATVVGVVANVTYFVKTVIDANNFTISSIS